MIQLLLHLWGDFIVQTDTQAQGKKLKGSYGSWCCFKHCLTYSLPFLFIGSWQAVLVIFSTHYLIDRTKLIDYLIAFKNGTKGVMIIKEGETPRFETNHYDISNFGFSKDRPQVLTLWLYIITDNIFHITINFLALTYL